MNEWMELEGFMDEVDGVTSAPPNLTAIRHRRSARFAHSRVKNEPWPECKVLKKRLLHFKFHNRQKRRIPFMPASQQDDILKLHLVLLLTDSIGSLV